MKVKLVLFAFVYLFSCTLVAKAQDQNIEQLKVNIDNIDTLLCDTIYGFKGPRGIIRGYQWGNEKSASIGILANQNSIITDFLFDRTTGLPDQNLQDSAYLLVSDFRFWTATIYDTSLSHSHSMTFEPTLHITENNPTQYQILEKRPNDPTRPIFGFTQIDNLARIPIDSSDPDSSFLIINNTTLIDSMVFSEPWGSEYLYRTDFEKMQNKNAFCQNPNLFLQKSKKNYVCTLVNNYLYDA
ncbi:MAG: hypothetical protein WCR42_16365 [bacterium]